MKKVFLTLTGIFLILSVSAQKRTSQFALFGGYENFSELWDGNGYNVGIEFKQYVHNRIYIAANFHAGINDGSTYTHYTTNNIPYNFNLTNSVRDYMIGFGLGADVLHLGKHKIYLQGIAGLGSSEQCKDGIILSITSAGAYDKVKTFEEKSTRFAISASAGYDYQLTDWLAIGVNYTGWQIGYEYKNSCNAKISVIF